MRELETERLNLRFFKADDVQEFFDNVSSDPEVTRYLSWNAYTDIEDARKFYCGYWLEEYKKAELGDAAQELMANAKEVNGINLITCLQTMHQFAAAFHHKEPFLATLRRLLLQRHKFLHLRILNTRNILFCHLLFVA